MLLGKVATLVLATIALLLGIATFAVLAGAVSRPFGPNRMFGLVLANLVALLLLGAALAGRLTRVWMERRRGSAGARLHVRLVMLFSGVAVIPAIVVAIFATAFFHYGIQAWFNDRVRTALHEALQTSQGYLAEHRDAIRADALAMANDLSRAGMLMSENPNAFADILATQTALRGLTEALIYEPITGQAMASAGLMSGLGIPKPPSAVTDMARRGDVALYDTDNGTEVHAVVQLDSLPTLMLMISRPVDPRILDHAARTQRAVAEYERLDQHRYGLQITFALIFALVALLVLSAAVLIGLVIANQIARPVGRLIQATERVRTGDLATRVPEAGRDDEIAGLSRAFNRMTGQLGAQRAELMDAYSQIDERRRFTEAVLAGVSAGVIGLDAAGGIELPNRAADELLGLDLLAAIGRPLSEEVPEFAPLLARARAIGGAGAATDEVQIGPANRRRTLLVRVGAELRGNRPDGYVVTFDDVTELEAAQRKAAWADVARRIAHEIKNPLTPIQLSAERLKRRFAREIQSDPETFAQCADTIVRQVGEIGRMVDEFSAFARMPQPVIRPEDVGRIAREALVLQRNARPEIVWATDIPESGPVAPCDRRLFGQALTNLLQNAADAVAMRQAQGDGEGEGKGEGESGGAGRIEVSVSSTEEFVTVQVTDDGVGLPQEEDRARLVEPYVTHKPKGTGLGLAIVKKIMEDHGGRVALDDRTDGPGAVATLVLPVRSTAAGEVRSTAAGEVRGTAAGEGGR
ncbi:MAG TPA: PAS domain-containing sensor histidine kinase [Acetobacteraceae bacterium]|nr:PAS domain-containing sensor histidine kinase [Acetobacteraceae bacterium]